ncbi:8931_t:CDS:2, partial [Funneliformis caledonium]
ELVPYGLQIQEELTNNKFEPSFASLITAFKLSSLKCVACQSFQKNMIDNIVTEFFGFEGYREKQRESILSFLLGQDTLTILKTGEEKSLIYAVASILTRGLTVVFTSQKALMDDQM